MTGQKIAAWAKKNQKILLVGILLAGGLLCMLPSLPKKPQPQAVKSEIDIRQETLDYQKELTDELTMLLQQCEGVGRVQVLITFESGVEYAYLKEEESNTDIRQEDQSRDYSERYLFVEDAAGNQKVLAVKRILPKVRGAVVVCEGGNDPMIKRQVVELLRAALGVSAGNISVSPLA